jgi:hypothetical protein
MKKTALSSLHKTITKIHNIKEITTMDAIGYIRVSTEDQAREGVSLDNQKSKIIAYAQLKDLTILEIIEDAGISAKNLETRSAEGSYTCAEETD